MHQAAQLCLSVSGFGLFNLNRMQREFPLRTFLTMGLLVGQESLVYMPLGKSRQTLF